MKTIGLNFKTLLASAITAACLASTSAQALTLKLATDSGTQGSPAGEALKNGAS
ncbi:hypothetical protein MBH78_21085 [Oceanimonas sp. NS1]|nr:hypothetical protein [Oceanimonas sp. NS1]